MDSGGQINESHTEASGLDFSGTGPEICYMASIGKINFKATSDKEAQETFLMMCRKTGILPAIEACYVIHAALKEIKRRKNPNENQNQLLTKITPPTPEDTDGVFPSTQIVV